MNEYTIVPIKKYRRQLKDSKRVYIRIFYTENTVATAASNYYLDIDREAIDLLNDRGCTFQTIDMTDPEFEKVIISVPDPYGETKDHVYQKKPG